MRPKVISFTLAGGATTTVYYPVDTHAAPSFAVGFLQSAGAGSITSCSVSYTTFNVLAFGTTSAGWTQLTAAAAAVTGYILPIIDQPMTCLRAAMTSSGAGTYGLTFLHPGVQAVGH